MYLTIELNIVVHTICDTFDFKTSNGIQMFNNRVEENFQFSCL